MLNFLKNLFVSTTKYSTGAIIPPADIRNIDIGEIQLPIKIPDYFLSDLKIWTAKDQLLESSCVGFTFASICEYIIFKIFGKIVKINGSKLYGKAKLEDGIPDQNGTYPNVMAKIITRDGVEDEDGVIYKIANGYAFVTIYDFELLAQAIYQNGAVASLFIIDKNWFIGLIGKMLQRVGGHEVVLYGYSKFPVPILNGLNSWGIGWVGRIASMLDRNVTAGHFEAKYEDIKDSLMSGIVLTQIPDPILDEVKNINYRLFNTMKKGSKGYDVKKLQERLGIIPADGIFGEKTRQAVMTFQFEKGLVHDGIVGIDTLKALNIGSKSCIPLLAKAIQQHEGYFTPNSKYPKGSLSFQNNNPGNIKGRDGKFIKFNTYEEGFTALQDYLIRACTGKHSAYNPNMSLYKFFCVYAPSSDNNNPLVYATTVAKNIGCSIDTKISLLV